MVLVFAVLAATILLFMSGRLRLDVVALLALLALGLTGVLTPAEAVAGFADPIVLMIAGLFVVGGALFETGVAARLGHLLGGVAGTSPARLTAAVMLTVALLSGFMSSTGAVAVMLPVVAAMAWDAGISPSRLLIPLAVGSLLGGMLTLIGTAPNIVVANQLAAEGYAPFRFFDFTPVGLVMLAAGVGFMVLFGGRLLPARAPATGPAAPDGIPALAAEELAQEYAVDAVGDLQDLAELLITPRSRLIGQTAASVRFPERYGVTVLGFTRGGERVPEDALALPLRFGDMLLVTGPGRRLALLRGEGRDLVVVARSAGRLGEARLRGPALRALGILAVMMVLLTFDLVPGVVAVLLAAVAAVLTRTIEVEDAYRAINWESVVLIAAILPMATALEKTGGMGVLVDGLSGVGTAGPLAMVAVLFLVTSVLSQVVSNTATTVLVAPVAFGAAVEMGVSPYPFLMTVAVAASTAFATPIASPVNTLVLGPGAYRFGDFLRVGAPLQALIFGLTLLVVPLLFPF
jgi:di/tricarboxylate transporter